MTDPNISFIIPALHESASIAHTLSRLFALDGIDRCEVVVVDGSPDADTLAAIDRTDVVRVASKPGRGRQMNSGAAVAKGRMLVFLHADTILPDDGIGLILAAYESGVELGAFDLGIDAAGIGYRIIEHAATLRSRITRLPYGDQGIFMSTALFQRLKGYPEWPVMEDVELMRRARKAGTRLRFVDARVKTSARRWEKEGMVRCTIRNWSIMILYLLGVSPERLARFYT